MNRTNLLSFHFVHPAPLSFMTFTTDFRQSMMKRFRTSTSRINIFTLVPSKNIQESVPVKTVPLMEFASLKRTLFIKFKSSSRKFFQKSKKPIIVPICKYFRNYGNFKLEKSSHSETNAANSTFKANTWSSLCKTVRLEKVRINFKPMPAKILSNYSTVHSWINSWLF